MQSSPFLVNLVTESQRLDEEHKARLAEEERRQNFMKKRKEKIKTEIILQALTEISDMEKLRLEKRSLLLVRVIAVGNIMGLLFTSCVLSCTCIHSHTCVYVTFDCHVGGAKGQSPFGPREDSAQICE